MRPSNGKNILFTEREKLLNVQHPESLTKFIWILPYVSSNSGSLLIRIIACENHEHLFLLTGSVPPRLMMYQDFGKVHDIHFILVLEGCALKSDIKKIYYLSK